MGSNASYWFERDISNETFDEKMISVSCVIQTYFTCPLDKAPYLKMAALNLTNILFKIL